MKRRLAVALVPCLMLSVSAVSLPGFELQLIVKEPAGVAQIDAPAFGGIPLRSGEFKSDQAFGVFLPDGSAVPSQVLPLVMDEKGYLRWVLVDIRSDLKPNEEKRFVLRPVSSVPKVETEVRVSENADEVIVDTGAIRFAIAKRKPFALFDRVECGGRRVASGGAVS
ncbi:MAG: hypothetical protein N2255_00005, partial [Kiritimatiellae bacterium]|nr:hypothetical protein [Kiritimatiellia bacterium]